MKDRPVSESKRALLAKFYASPIGLGERLYVRGERSPFKVVAVEGDVLTVSRAGHTKKVNADEVDCRLDEKSVGANPFDPRKKSICPVAFRLSSILHGIAQDRDDRYSIGGHPVKETNWNPYVGHCDNKLKASLELGMRRGYMLYGPPGVGKTTVIRKLANVSSGS